MMMMKTFWCQLFLLSTLSLAAVFASNSDVLRLLMSKRPLALLDTAKDKRIAGGDTDWSNDYTFQVQLKELGQHVCGAVLLNNSWAITAAHCTLGRDPTRLSIETDATFGAGRTRLPTSVRTLAKVVVHPQFDAATMANNIALLQIGQTTVLSNLESPSSSSSTKRATTAIVHLPEPGQKFTDMVTLVGYGSTSNRVPRESGEKRIVSLPIAALSRCRSLYGQNLINSGQLCAGDSYTGQGLCQGDAGSGAVQLDGDEAGGGVQRQVLVGVGSFGFDCGNGRYPSVFTAVADYVEWIQEVSVSA